jgi:hypothetical protein
VTRKLSSATCQANYCLSVTTQYHFSPESCSCLKRPERCRTAVIKHADGAKFKFKVHSVTKENIHMWDLALFATPRHPGFHKLKSGDTTYLNLDFATAAERNDFVVAFNKLIKIYGKEVKDYESFHAQRANMSDCPKKAPLPPGLQCPRSPSIASIDSSKTVLTPTNLASGPPTLALNLNFSKLSLNF